MLSVQVWFITLAMPIEFLLLGKGIKRKKGSEIHHIPFNISIFDFCHHFTNDFFDQLLVYFSDFPGFTIAEFRTSLIIPAIAGIPASARPAISATLLPSSIAGTLKFSAILAAKAICP